ncbi:MAG: ECF RNA polymerase sigma factor SigW [bacterium]|nr:ECF RNA polymerase sigma factor SigW [bacterium]
MEKSTDAELMGQVLKKNTRAFKILYSRYEMRVYNFILRYTGNKEIAQDLLQETFTRVWFAAHLFNLETGNFRGWLYTIALNIARNEMSRKRYAYDYAEVSTIAFKDEPVNPRTEEPDAAVERADLQNAISQALLKLSPLLREIIILKHYQQLKFKEIAEMTKTPEGTLKARFHRAIAELKELLDPREL